MAAGGFRAGGAILEHPPLAKEGGVDARDAEVGGGEVLGERVELRHRHRDGEDAGRILRRADNLARDLQRVARNGGELLHLEAHHRGNGFGLDGRERDDFGDQLVGRQGEDAAVGGVERLPRRGQGLGEGTLNR